MSSSASASSLLKLPIDNAELGHFTLLGTLRMTTSTPCTTSRKTSIFYCRISQMLRYVECVYRSQNLLKFDSVMPAFKSKQTKNKPPSFTFSKIPRTLICHFTLLFCRGRLRNVQGIKTHVHSHCSAH